MSHSSPGTIAVCSREDHAWPQFATSLARLVARHPDVHVVHPMGTNVAAARNAAVREMRGDWLWFIDTDMVVPDVALGRLLAREVPVVQPLVLLRHPPHAPIVFEQGAPDHRRARRPGGSPGLYEVPAVGAGGTLYRREAFAAVLDPWFEGAAEDLAFAAKLRAAGVPLHVDTTVCVGHITPVIVLARYDEGWNIQYVTMTGQSVDLPFPSA